MAEKSFKAKSKGILKQHRKIVLFQNTYYVLWLIINLILDMMGKTKSDTQNVDRFELYILCSFSLSYLSKLEFSTI